MNSLSSGFLSSSYPLYKQFLLRLNGMSFYQLYNYFSGIISRIYVVVVVSVLRCRQGHGFHVLHNYILFSYGLEKSIERCFSVAFLPVFSWKYYLQYTYIYNIKHTCIISLLYIYKQIYQIYRLHIFKIAAAAQLHTLGPCLSTSLIWLCFCLEPNQAYCRFLIE